VEKSTRKNGNMKKWLINRKKAKCQKIGRQNVTKKIGKNGKMARKQTGA
jgi:hypothetical protein